MGLRLDDEGDDTVTAAAAAVAPLEFPRHARVGRDHKVHTFDEFYEQTEGAKDPHADNERDEETDEEQDDACDQKPLLQQIKMTRTSSTKVKDAQQARATASVTMVSVAATVEARVKRLAGLGYIVLAALNISLMSACIKFATHHVTSHEAVFWRTILSWALNYACVRAKRVDLYVAPQHRKLLFFRCVVGMMCISFAYYAYSKMVLTDAVVIVFTSPTITFFLGALFLGEAIDRVDFACSLVSYVGVVFVTRPAWLFPPTAGSRKSDTVAVLCALGAAVTQAVIYIAMRKLHDVHYMVISHYFAGFGIFFSLATLWVFGAPLRVPELVSVQLALLASAVFSCVGLLFLTRGFQIEKAGIASVMRYFDVVFVFVLDTTFLGEQVDAYSVLGGAIIIAGAVVIAVRRAKK